MKIFPVPFSLANEVVKRSVFDNRRIAELPEHGGNNLFYLGTPVQFIEKFDGLLRERIIEIETLCNEKFYNPHINPRTLQKGEGILVNHMISKDSLLSLIPFIEPYLEQYANLYHNPNFNRQNILEELDAISSENVSFYSDLVFIRDAKWARPYFKWFDYEDTINNFKLVQEFFIPHLSFLNFEYLNYDNNILEIRWELSYTITVLYSSENVEALVSKALEELPINQEDKETIREAITKIRIGQSQFRTDLLNSDRNSCLFTTINDPKLLIASHIKPWRNSENYERLDLNNGILLTPTFDKLFDKFLITFNENGTLRWSRTRLDDQTIEKIIQGCPAYSDIIIDINDSNRHYFNHHRDMFERLENNND